MTWLKAKVLLATIAVLWLFFIVIMLPLQLPVTLLAPKSRYTWAIWIGQDQMVNALLFGNPDITISSRIGYHAKRGSKTALAMEKVVDWLFYKIAGEKNHCRTHIELDERHY
jgi:hypothetical protein